MKVRANRGRIMVVEDEDVQRLMMVETLEETGYEVDAFERPALALQQLEQERYDTLLTDFRMPGMTGLELIQHALRLDPTMSCVIITAYGTIETAVEVIKAGAYDYITKPVDLEALLLLVKRAVQRRGLVEENRLLREQLRERYSMEGLVGQSSRMQEIFSQVYRVAPTAATVLLTGESGTGKELIARAIHLNSPRKDRQFVAVNCAALPETLLESELFGHEKGAFTGATGARMGKFEAAHGGTLLLDEIGEIPLHIQVKLLRFLQERKLERLGSNRPVDVDVRLIAATNRRLEQEMAEGRFREDLFWRLNVVSIHLPPLRERREDLPSLIDHFMAKYASTNEKKLRGYSREFFSALQRYGFPGNIRELENMIERAVVMTRADILTVDDLPSYVAPEQISRPTIEAEGSLPDILEAVERDLIARALTDAGNVQTRAAERLGISERVLRYKMKKHGLRE